MPTGYQYSSRLTRSGVVLDEGDTLIDFGQLLLESDLDFEKLSAFEVHPTFLAREALLIGLKLSGDLLSTLFLLDKRLLSAWARARLSRRQFSFCLCPWICAMVSSTRSASSWSVFCFSWAAPLISRKRCSSMPLAGLLEKQLRLEN